MPAYLNARYLYKNHNSTYNSRADAISTATKHLWFPIRPILTHLLRRTLIPILVTIEN